jgi:formiminoglutamase
MQHLKIYNKQDIVSLTKIRRFETKLGERINMVQDAGCRKRDKEIAQRVSALTWRPHVLCGKKTTCNI